MRVCPKCSHENADDRDFCERCNTYLRWEPTVLTPSVSGGTEATPQAPVDPSADTLPPGPISHVAQRLPVIKEGQTLPVVHTKPLPAATELVQITLRLPGDDGAGTEFAKADVVPGTRAIVHALVRNQSGIVDNYELSIDGMPPEWWTITPSTVYLVPFGAPGGEYEQEVEIQLHPPRSPEAEARAWPLRVVALSKAHGVEAGSATITATIAPYQEFEVELRPEYGRGRWRGNFAVAVRNRANAPTDFAFSAVDSDNACHFIFDDPVVTAAPGRRAGTKFKARPRKQLWVGRPVDRRYQVTTTVPGTDSSVLSRPAVFRQKPWLPRWLPLAIPIVAGAIAAVIILLPHNTTVPDVRGMRVFAAKQLLEKDGLVLGEQTDGAKTRKTKKIGRIQAQSKPVGTKVKKGTAISVEVFIGTGTTTVPDLKHMTLNEARDALDQVQLQVGNTQPEPSNPDKGKVVSQSPASGKVIAIGRSVDLFFPAVKEETTTTGATTTGTTTETSGSNGTQAGKGIKGSLAVPSLLGAGVGAAFATLTAKGFEPQQLEAFSTEKRGTVIDQSPKDGVPLTKGAPVQVTVSAGYPRIAFDDGHDLKLMNGADGSRVKALANTADLEDEPTWQPGGSIVAYRRANDTSSTIWIVDTNNPATSAQRFTEGPNDRRPAFSPNGKVVAFIRAESSGKNDLCFRPYKKPNVSCVTTVTQTVDRPAWSPDGRAILTIAKDPNDPNSKWQLFLFTTNTPFSPNASTWSAQGPRGPTNGSVSYAAFSPSPESTQVAVAANWGAKDPATFSLFLLPWTSSGLGKAKGVPSVRACEVAWRPDGKELAVSQSVGCEKETETMVRIDPADPSNAAPLGLGIASDPVWEPLTLAKH
jgi:beta-lactam-binding protein with PASTA domain